jgi:hypothetical protein
LKALRHTKRAPCDDEDRTRVRQLQAKEGQRLPATHETPGKHKEGFPDSFQRENGLLAWKLCLWLYSKPLSLWHFVVATLINFYIISFPLHTKLFAWAENRFFYALNVPFAWHLSALWNYHPIPLLPFESKCPEN